MDNFALDALFFIIKFIFIIVGGMGRVGKGREETFLIFDNRRRGSD